MAKTFFEFPINTIVLPSAEYLLISSLETSNDPSSINDSLAA